MQQPHGPSRPVATSTTAFGPPLRVRRCLAAAACALAGLLGLPAQVALAQACDMGAATPDPRLHTLYIDGKGALLDPESRQPVAGPEPLGASAKARLKASKLPEQRYVQAMLDHFVALRAQCPGLQLTVYVHGGLNTFGNTAGRARQFSRQMLAEGHYPVFIGWDSSALPNYFDHLFRIRKGERKPLLAPLTSPLVLLEDLARSLVRIPAALYKEVHEGLTVLPAVTAEEEEDYNDRRGRLVTTGLTIVPAKAEDAKEAKGVGRSYWSVVNPLKLVGAPLVDGLGSGAWDSMLRRTDLVLSKSSAFEDEPPLEVSEYADTAATRFLREWQDKVQSKGVVVNLIGHSMGAIVVTNILARHPLLRVDNVVFMGGAARIKDVADVVVPWLASPLHAQARFYNLSLDPYNELAERVWLDSAPRGSLLNWIDGIFGEVNSFQDRTVGSWWNITRTAEDVFRVHGLQPRLAERVTLKRFAIGDDQGPQVHGAFDEYCFWRRAFWDSDAKPIRQSASNPGCAAP